MHLQPRMLLALMGAGWISLYILVTLVLIALLVAIYRLRKGGAFAMARKRGTYSDAVYIGCWFVGSALLGDGLVFLVVYFATKQWSSTAVAELWSMGCLMTGGALGFLFGIPKSVQGQAPSVSSAGKTPGRAAYAQRVNTSLEEVSDWLTKLLLGVGLVQLRKVPELLQTYSTMMGADGWYLKNTQGFGIAVIVYFSILGFLGFYLMTRLYLQRALGEAATMGLDTAPVKANLSIEETIALKSAPIGFGSRDRELTGVATKAAKKLLTEVGMNELETAHDYALWGKAQLDEANYAETDADKAAAYKSAVAAYKQASRLAPSDIEIQQEYAVAMFLERSTQKTDFKGDQPFLVAVKDQLMKAYSSLCPNTSYELRENIYKSLTWIVLYVAPPAGYEEAIRIAEEYNQDPRHMPSGGIQVNLACGYGQKMKILKAEEKSLKERLASERDPAKKPPIQAAVERNTADQVQVRSSALKAIRDALSLDPTWKGTFVEVLIKSKGEKGDDDLIAFKEDNEFRTTLGLPLI